MHVQWHGTKGNKDWTTPTLVASSSQANRADQGNQILANEYLDTSDVLKSKVKLMAEMIRKAKLCCAYTGAGLSKSSGIPDYATKASNSVVSEAPKLRSNLDALPTFTHCALTSMERAGFLHHYVQQNHDGLPQKSGFPQEKINEIHGAWYDPSNPVVQFSGSLRTDLFNWMIDIEKKIDLCLCLGTSLSGMNADRVAEKPAKRSLTEPDIIGTIIINIQKTRLDDICALRIWGKLDEVFTLLAQELGLGTIKSHFSFPTNETVFKVPYNSQGKLDHSCSMILDLSPGKEIYIPVKGASNFGAKGVVLGQKDNEWGWTVELREIQKLGSERICQRILGVWWITAAMEGKVASLPVMNINPVVIPTALADSAPKPPQIPILTKPKIAIIQSHELVAGPDLNSHKWALSLDRDSAKLVQKVDWHLHPTFHPNMISCTEAPFTISRIGWGTFTVKADIILKQEYGAHKVTGMHELTFNGGGLNVKTTLLEVI